MQAIADALVLLEENHIAVFDEHIAQWKQPVANRVDIAPLGGSEVMESQTCRESEAQHLVQHCELLSLVAERFSGVLAL